MSIIHFIACLYPIIHLIACLFLQHSFHSMPIFNHSFNSMLIFATLIYTARSKECDMANQTHPAFQSSLSAELDRSEAEVQPADKLRGNTGYDEVFHVARTLRMLYMFYTTRKYASCVGETFIKLILKIHIILIYWKISSEMWSMYKFYFHLLLSLDSGSMLRTNVVKLLEVNLIM